MLHDQHPAVSLLDEHGDVTARLWEANGKPVLHLTFGGSLRASLAVAPDTSTGLIIGTDAGSVTVGTMAGEPVVILRRDDGATRVLAAANKPRRRKPTAKPERRRPRR